MESAGVLFTIAMAFINGGIAMLTGNVWIYLLDVATEVLLKKEKAYSNEINSLGVLIIGLVSLFVGKINCATKYPTLASTITEFMRQGLCELYVSVGIETRNRTGRLTSVYHRFIGSNPLGG